MFKRQIIIGCIKLILITRAWRKWSILLLILWLILQNLWLDYGSAGWIKSGNIQKKRRIIPDRYMQNGTQTPARQNSDTARSENYTYPKNTSAKRHAAGHAFPEIDTAALSFFKNLHPAKFPPFIMHFCFPEVYSRWIFVSMAGASPAPSSLHWHKNPSAVFSA